MVHEMLAIDPDAPAIPMKGVARRGRATRSEAEAEAEGQPTLLLLSTSALARAYPASKVTP